MHAILKCLQLNPFLPMEYLELGLELIDNRSGRIWVKDCAALNEPVPRGLCNQLTHKPDQPGFDAMVAAVNPNAVVSRIDADEIDGAKIAWKIEIGDTDRAYEPSQYAGLVETPDLWNLDNTAYQYDYR